MARRKRNPSMSQELDPGQEHMLDQVVLIAVNEGQFYPKRPAEAVRYALREYQRLAAEAMREDARVVEQYAVAEVRRQWSSKNPARARRAAKGSGLYVVMVDARDYRHQPKYSILGRVRETRMPRSDARYAELLKPYQRRVRHYAQSLYLMTASEVRRLRLI